MCEVFILMHPLCEILKVYLQYTLLLTYYRKVLIQGYVKNITHQSLQNNKNGMMEILKMRYKEIKLL